MQPETYHVEIGRLDHDGRSLGLVRLNGERWRITAPRRARRMIGRRVRVEGTRVGHDELDVTRIEILVPAGEQTVERRWIQRATIAAAIVVIALTIWIVAT
jgi:hypothetical protein